LSYRESAIDHKPGFRPIDIATLAYIIVQAVLASLFLSGKPIWYLYLGLYISVAILIFLVSMINSAGPVWMTIRLVYPLIIIPVLYRALDNQVFMIHKIPFDSQINSFEMAFLGFDSSFALQRHITVWRNEIMSLAYMSYYFLIPGAAFALAIYRKWESLERMALSASVTFYVCYLIFIFFPVVGPRIYLGNIFYLPIDGPVVTPFVHSIVESGGLYGGAMPSSHCGVALVLVWYLVKEFRRLTFPLLTLLILLCVSTIYGRFHYLSDVVAGLILGGIVLWITSLWQHRHFEWRIRDDKLHRSYPEPSQEVEVTGETTLSA